MAAGISRPDVWFGYCANRDPSDLNTPSVWTSMQSADLQVLASTEQMRGRDYELAQPMAADPLLLVRDVNEVLNPDNPSSPLAGYVESYREICALAQWPIAPVGGAVNLINSSTWRGSKVDAYDPTFESYTTGASAPNWLDRFRVAPTITTTNPQQGAKSVTFAADTSGSGQGLAWGVPCIPGRQYTSSAYVRQSAANTMGIFVEGVTAAWDDFGRTVASGLGAPNASWNGISYTASGGAAGDYNVAGGQAVFTLTSTAVFRRGLLSGFFDSAQAPLVTAPVLATGNAYQIGVVSRHVDINNMYRAVLQFGTDSSVTLIIQRLLAGVTTDLSSTLMPFPYAAGDKFNLFFDTTGVALSAHCWPDGRAESLIFSTPSVADSSAALQVSAAIGLFAQRLTGNTNTNLPAAFDGYSATASVAGTSTATSGAYVRLSVTYTADGVARPAGLNASPLGKRPPGLAASVLTIGATSAATVNVDAIQHEQAAGASTFSADGPVIYPLFRNSAERYPRTWRNAGYEGMTAIPCVDALALLNKIFVHNPADQSILNTQPDYFWTLGGGPDSTSWPDASGNSQPALTRFVSKYGAGTDIESGVALQITAPVTEAGTGTALAGDPNGTGVHITAVNAGTGGARPGTALQFPGRLPAMVGFSGWAMSFGCWARVDANPTADPEGTLFITSIATAGGQVIIPGMLSVTSTSNVRFEFGFQLGGSFTDLAVSVVDGLFHHFAFSISQTSADTTWQLWVDGSAAGAVASIATSAFGLLTAQGSLVTLGVDSGGTVWSFLNGIIAKAAVWNRFLTDDEVQSMYTAGGFGLNGELSGARILRHLQEGPYGGPTRISQNFNQTAMGVPSFDGSIDLLADSLNTMQAEQGVLWVQPDGVVAFEGRQDRWLRLASTNTFGEDGAGGEIPYQDGIVFDHDPTYVFPVVTWTRNNGGTAVGGNPRDRQQAMAKFFPRQFDGSNDLFDDEVTQDIADWIFYTHRSPNTRVAEIEIDPWAAQGTPYSLWAKVLGLEVGQRVTAVRRAKAANNGAGLVMSLPFFIERVGFPEINFTMGSERWTVALQLSPIGSAAAGGPTVQPWILEDATYGVLDSTTVLGF